MGRDSTPKTKKTKGNKKSKTEAAAADSLLLDPLLIRFTHSKIRTSFSGCNKTIEQTMEEIRIGTITPADLPIITVMPLEDGESYCSLNNRRLFVHKWARKEGYLPENVRFVMIDSVISLARLTSWSHVC
eukprot:m.99836 g.99836  ORF g.99836 m.99836 type:complete len:130 (-) comp16769_c0_seq13:3029-3418(-)